MLGEDTGLESPVNRQAGKPALLLLRFPLQRSGLIKSTGEMALRVENTVTCRQPQRVERLFSAHDHPEIFRILFVMHLHDHFQA